MVFALVRPSVPNATCCRGRIADITPELPPLPAGGRVCTDVKEGDDVSAAPVFTQVGSSTETPARQLCSGQKGRFTGEINLHNAENIGPVFVHGLAWVNLDKLSCHSSGAVWKSRGTSWAPVPNKPTVSVDVKQYFNCHDLLGS